RPGDTVIKGQTVGEAAEVGLSVPVHASVSGKVTEVSQKTDAAGRAVTCVKIENDFGTGVHESAEPYSGDPEDFDAAVRFIKDKGLVGLGGSGYPVYAKLKNVRRSTKTLIINATECEPFCSSTTRTLIESPKDVIRGARILTALLSPVNVFLVTETRHRKLGAKLCEISKGTMEPKTVPDRYPAGDERQIVKALFKKELSADALPSAAACAVFNAATCAAIAAAFDRGTPFTERIVTASGDCFAQKKNLRVPLGTSVRELSKSCGGFVSKPYMLVLGGPMLGNCADSREAPVTKTVGAVMAFRERCRSGSEDCIHCGRCVKVCPMGLMPFYFERAVRSSLPLPARRTFDPSLCCECGLCTYICPANVPLNYLIKISKKRGAV
ncbi:MAG: RnfABCDGE type electron transport complex subunit C, partial [Clostridia bacterium]|nr:RnfABCDGE type electron transport complex subunit C [Clostridia bacterium]